MLSAFSNEVRDLIYKLDSIPRTQDLLISSIGTDSLVKRIDNSITQVIVNKPSWSKRCYDLFKGDFVPVIAFSTKKMIVYVLYYKDKTYLSSNMNFNTISKTDIVYSTSILNRWPVKIIDKKYVDKSNVKDKDVYIITSEYARYLSEKDIYQYYPAFIQYFYTLLSERILYSKKQHNLSYLFSGILPNGRIYEPRVTEGPVRVYMYYYLAIVYHLYCKYANDIDDLPLQRFYNSIKEMKLYDSYEKFVEENKKLKEILN